MKRLVIAALLVAGCASQPPDSASETATSPQVMPEATAVAIARPPGSYTPDEVYGKLLTIADESQKKLPRPKQGSEFNLSLPSEKPRGDEKGEWISSYVAVYYRDKETVNQITLVTENCNVKPEALDQTAMKNRIQAQVALVTKTLFTLPFALSDKYFRAFEELSLQPVRVPIKEDYAPVVDMRLMRGVSKCDGKTGYYYRHDFFMK